MIKICPLVIDRGVFLLFVAITCLVVPGKWVAIAVYIGSVPLILGNLFLAITTHLISHSKHSQHPDWAKEAMAPMRGVFVFNLLLVLTGLVLLWQRYPLWGGA